MGTTELEQISARTPPFPARAGFAAAATLALIFLFRDALANLWLRWGSQEELSHSYFLPLVSLWLVWANRRTVIKSVGAPSFVGAAIVGVALLLLLLGQLTSIFLLQHLGLIVAIAGLVASFGGLSLLRTVAAPIAFLLFAVPPPYWVITVLSWKFQQMSSFLGVMMLQLMQVPVLQQGNIIDLGNYKLQVAEACSGLRYLFPFLSLGVMSAYLYRGPFWHKAAIVLSTIPITVLMNSVRIAATGALVAAQGPEHAEGALHFFEGWVVFIFCLAALVGAVAILGRLRTPPISALEALGAAPELPLTTPRRAGGPAPAVFAALIAAAAGAFLLGRALNVDTLIKPERRDFDAIPTEFAGWRHEVRPIDPTVAEVLGADDSLVVDLVSPEGDYYNLYVAYLDAQRDGRSWHSPRQCIPGGGWQILEHTVERTTTASGDALSYNRMVIRNGKHRQLVYYWYDQRGRKIANEFTMKFWLIVDAATKKRSDGAMVRLISPLPDEGSIGNADEKLQGLMARVNGFLPAYVPR